MALRKYLLTLSALGACTLAAFAQTGTTTTSTTSSTRQTSFAPMGLASSETAQVNVVNLASDSSGGTAASCTGTITFLSATGATLQSATSFTVTSGQTFSVKFAGGGSRQVIRGVISATFTSSTPCTLASSMETYDTTSGATHAFLDGGELDSGNASVTPPSGGGGTPPGQ